MDLRYNDIYLKGVAEGKKEAKERWMIKIISYGLKQNWPLEDLAYLVESSPSFLSFFYTFIYFI